MSFLRRTWPILVNVLALAVVLAMFRVASSPFETVVISGLTLIYVTMISYSTIMIRSDLERDQAIAHIMIGLAELSKDPAVGTYKEELARVAEAFRSTTLVYAINSVFVFVIWAIAILYLLRVVGWR